MGIVLKVLDPTENCPAASVAGHVVGDFSEAKTVRFALLPSTKDYWAAGSTYQLMAASV